MALLTYGLSRNVPMETESGEDVMGCLVAIMHENGTRDRMMIREDRIAFYGEGIIRDEIERKYGKAIQPLVASV